VDKWLNNVNVVRVAALLLGILLWLVVRLNYEQTTPIKNNPVFQTDTIVDAQVTVAGLDTDQYHLASIEPEEVDIIVEGTSSALNRIPTSQYAIIADVSGLAEGTHQVPLIARNFPSGVDVTLNPDTVTVKIERMDTKQFDVTIELSGKPVEGLRAGVPVANPARVHVTVPSSQLGQVSSIRGYLDIEGASETIVREVKLEAYNASGQKLEGVTISPSIVSVEVPITPPIRSVPLQVSFIGKPPAGLSVASVSQNVSFVTISGPQEVIDAIEFYDGVSVDLSRLTGDSTVTVELPLKPGVTSVEPGEVQVSIDLEPTVQRTFNSVPIRLFGQDDAYEIELVEPESGVVSLTVQGAAALVNALTAGDVQVILDVSNVAPGSYVLPLRVNLPRFVELATADVLRASVVVSMPADETSGSGGNGTGGDSGGESGPPGGDEAADEAGDGLAETAEGSSQGDVAEAAHGQGQHATYSG